MNLNSHAQKCNNVHPRQSTTPSTAASSIRTHQKLPRAVAELPAYFNVPDMTNKHLRCGNRKGLLGRNDQTHHRMDPEHPVPLAQRRGNSSLHAELTQPTSPNKGHVMHAPKPTTTAATTRVIFLTHVACCMRQTPQKPLQPSTPLPLTT